MRINRIERNITVALFFLVLIVFSFAQEKSRAIERVYINKWNLNAAVPAKSPGTPTTGPVIQTQGKAD